MSITTGLDQTRSAELSRIHANGPRGLRRPTVDQRENDLLDRDADWLARFDHDRVVGFVRRVVGRNALEGSLLAGLRFEGEGVLPGDNRGLELPVGRDIHRELNLIRIRGQEVQLHIAKRLPIGTGNGSRDIDR